MNLVWDPTTDGKWKKIGLKLHFLIVGPGVWLGEPSGDFGFCIQVAISYCGGMLGWDHGEPPGVITTPRLY